MIPESIASSSCSQSRVQSSGGPRLCVPYRLSYLHLLVEAYQSESDGLFMFVLGLRHSVRCERKMEDRAAPLSPRVPDVLFQGYQVTGMVRNDRLTQQKHHHFRSMGKTKQGATSLVESSLGLSRVDV